MHTADASHPVAPAPRRARAGTGLGLCVVLYVAAHAAAGETSMVAAADAEHGKILYLKYCTSCHGPQAWGDGPRAIPALAGQRDRYVSEQLAAFAAATRAGQSMHEMMRHTDLNRAQAIADLAAYLSQAPRGRAPEQGRARDLGPAAALYQHACAGCHGQDGSGQPAGTPAIGGQHYRYLLARLSDFSTTHQERVAAPSGANGSAKALEALAEYVARLGALIAGSEGR